MKTPVKSEADALALARQQYAAGRLAQADVGCRQLLKIQPNNADAINLLGLVIASKNSDEAIQLVRRAIELNPTDADFHNNLGCLLHGRKQFGDAIAAYRQAIVLRDKYVEAILNLATTLFDTRELDEGASLCRRALIESPDSFRAHLLLGNFRRAQGDLAGAEESYREAMKLNPNLGPAWTSLTIIERETGRFEAARRSARRAVAMNPRSAIDHFNHALELLRAGDFANGWMEHEWRWRLPQYPNKRPNLKCPAWLGTDPSGKSVFVYPELGFSETLMMARFVPLLAGRGAFVKLGCAAESYRLFQSLKGASELVRPGDQLNGIDLHVGMMSLPMAFCVRPDSIPWNGPYVAPNAALVEMWRPRLHREGTNRRRVGLAWAGLREAADDRSRSFSLEDLSLLAEVAGVEWISLQSGPAAGQIGQRGAAFGLTDHSAEFSDLADIAGAMSHVDLVICADNAVAHLAGAMGKPCWVLLGKAPDWRWMIDRSDSPWYPSMTLFRPGAEGVVQAVAQRLSTWAVGGAT